MFIIFRYLLNFASLKSAGAGAGAGGGGGGGGGAGGGGFAPPDPFCTLLDILIIPLSLLHPDGLLPGLLFSDVGGGGLSNTGVCGPVVSPDVGGGGLSNTGVCGTSAPSGGCAESGVDVSISSSGATAAVVCSLAAPD